MKIFFDTSVIVAALVTEHPHHRRALPWLQAARSGKISGLASYHALAETWSVLTRLPLTPPLSGAAAGQMVLRLDDSLQWAAPTARIYREALNRCALRSLRSGVIFDALHLISAERARVDALLTFNADDFERLRQGTAVRILVPPDPPRVAL